MGAMNSPFWPGGHCPHARLRCSLLGKRPTTHCPPREDHAADLGGHGQRAPAWGGELGLGPRSGRGRDCREHPARATSGPRRPATRGRPESTRSGARTVLQSLTFRQYGVAIGPLLSLIFTRVRRRRVFPEVRMHDPAQPRIDWGPTSLATRRLLSGHPRPQRSASSARAS